MVKLPVPSEIVALVPLCEIFKSVELPTPNNALSTTLSAEPVNSNIEPVNL